MFKITVIDYQDSLKNNKMKIGTITIEQQLKAIKKGNRDAELVLSPGWVAKNKVHSSNKTYTRKKKHK
jgi:hypothetical protein